MAYLWRSIIFGERGVLTPCLVGVTRALTRPARRNEPLGKQARECNNSGCIESMSNRPLPPSGANHHDAAGPPGRLAFPADRQFFSPVVGGAWQRAAGRAAVSGQVSRYPPLQPAVT